MQSIRGLLRLVLLGVVLVALAVTTTSARAAGAAQAAPNDATQARLRVSQCVYGEPEMDIYLNGQIPVDADIPLAVRQGDVTRYEYLAPGTHSLVVVPNGQDLSKAFLGPLDVTLAAGHRYTVVALGQKDEPSHQALVIDETAAAAAIGAGPLDFVHFIVNNIRGLAGLDFYQGGIVRDANVPYGGFKAARWPVGWWKGLKVTVAGAPDQPLDPGFDGDGYNPPALSTLDCFGGTYPGTIGQDFDTHSSANTSPLNAVDLLQAFNAEAGKSGKGSPSNNTFLAAVQAAGLTDMLAHGGPYIIFAPTDEAFAALPKGTLDALMADKQALGAFLRRHIVAGYYPPLTLVKVKYVGRFDRTVTNLLGEPVVLATASDDGLLINGENAGNSDSVMVAGGTRLFPWIGKVLLPATAAPGMPRTGAGTTAGPLPAGLAALLLATLALLLAGSLLRRRVIQR